MVSELLSETALFPLGMCMCVYVWGWGSRTLYRVECDLAKITQGTGAGIRDLNSGLAQSQWLFLL